MKAGGKDAVKANKERKDAVNPDKLLIQKNIRCTGNTEQNRCTIIIIINKKFTLLF